MLEGGLTLTQALAVLAKNSVWNNLAGPLITQIEGGATFSAALRPKAGENGLGFPVLLSDLAVVGEQSGQLEPALLQAADYFERREAFRKKIIRALSYPCFVLGLSLMSLLFLVFFVLPSFAGIMQELHVELPAITLVLLNTGIFFQNHFILISVIAGGGYFWVRAWLSKEVNQEKLDRLMVEQSWLKSFTYQYYLARISQSLGLLLSGGMPLLNAVNIAAAGTTNRVLSRQLSESAQKLEQGKPFSIALEECGIHDDLLLQMVEIGEKDGRLERTFTELNRLYESELEDKLQVLTSLLEPLSTLVVGAVVAGIALSIFVPLLSVLNSFN